MLQSSCSQPPHTWRVTEYWCSVSDDEWSTQRTNGAPAAVRIAASGAWFHVDASCMSGNICWSWAELGTGPPWALMFPSHRRHQMNWLPNLMYSTPSLMSWRPPLLNEVV